jgi:rubrerythrin
VSRIRTRCAICGAPFYPEDPSEKLCPECQLDADDFGIEIDALFGFDKEDE